MKKHNHIELNTAKLYTYESMLWKPHTTTTITTATTFSFI